MSTSFIAEKTTISGEVANAIVDRRPVVALETTLVTHGLPQPHGLRVAAALEAAVRERNAVPATIGILAGKICVGMNHEQLEQLASAREVAKLNLSNFAAHLAAGTNGSTTVAATMFVSHLARIPVFATGGIGGVHCDVAATGDVSADLIAMSRFPVAVVSAGAKAVLDLPKTVEMLETLGVPVLGYGTDEFPAFYCRQSGLRVDFRCNDPASLAAAVRTHFELGLGSGVLIGNPIPASQELPQELCEQAIAAALADANTQRVQGRDVTPFLLERMRQLTNGLSIEVNEALLINNARLAAELAVELAKVK